MHTGIGDLLKEPAGLVEAMTTLIEAANNRRGHSRIAPRGNKVCHPQGTPH